MSAETAAHKPDRQAGGAQRSRTNDRVRETREKLANGIELKPELEYGLMLMFARNELAAQATLIIVAGMFAAASVFWAPWFQAGIWLPVGPTRPFSRTWICLVLSASCTIAEPSSGKIGPAPLPLAWWQAAQLPA